MHVDLNMHNHNRHAASKLVICLLELAFQTLYETLAQMIDGPFHIFIIDGILDVKKPFATIRDQEIIISKGGGHEG